MIDLAALSVKIFADGADLAGIRAMAATPWVRGFTTNPTLMRKAGVRDYREFALQVLEAVPDRPVSFEVFADDLDEMERQAREIARWGVNVNVKIPVTNTRRESSAPLLRRLTQSGVKVNVTAVFTLEQVKDVGESPRGAQRRPGPRGRVPHHHRDQRHPCQAVVSRQGPRAILPGDRGDVPSGRQGGGVHHPRRGRVSGRAGTREGSGS